MKCAEALDWISEYTDMPADDPRRLAIDNHLQECEGCAEQYRIWAASEEWNEDLMDWEAEDEVFERITFEPALVMERIYSEDQWLMPVHRRGHRMSPRTRNVLAGIISFCLAVFLCSLIVLVIRLEPSKAEPVTGLIPAVIAGSTDATTNAIIVDIPADSAIEPLLLVPTVPHYWIALSLFGVTFALLLLNWLTRVKQ
ncbi:zf-HC2 domain-containing protein [Paenibacillus taiwanensis]|uniref:zf-HC2 domain-containing protein n=1 Tax=Paenibacillus taiwanensis TaxID=401638 RepID=UPI00040F8EE5|nr:zf-HC2 domain-containing protein [Paenibacillus taiwanensis]